MESPAHWLLTGSSPLSEWYAKSSQVSVELDAGVLEASVKSCKLVVSKAKPSKLKCFSEDRLTDVA